jgi:hypothetical protein
MVSLFRLKNADYLAIFLKINLRKYFLAYIFASKCLHKGIGVIDEHLIESAKTYKVDEGLEQTAACELLIAFTQ